MKKIFKQLGTLTVASILLLNASATLVSAQGDDRPFEGEEVSIGVVGDVADSMWNYLGEVALEEEGIELEVVLLTDYNQPNEAVDNGSLDLNAFQHVAFLNEWNEANDADLVHIGFTTVNPLGLYSEKISSLDELENGATIAIPNDPTNGGRALLALEIAGLIEVDDAAGVLPTPDDITDNSKNLNIQELDASQIAIALPDVDAAFINTGFANDAGLSLEDAIFFDAEDKDQLNEVYKNIVVVRAEDAENPLYLKLVELYQTEEVAKQIVELSNGGSLPAWDDADDAVTVTEDNKDSEDSDN